VPDEQCPNAECGLARQEQRKDIDRYQYRSRIPSDTVPGERVPVNDDRERRNVAGATKYWRRVDSVSFNGRVPCNFG